MQRYGSRLLLSLLYYLCDGLLTGMMTSGEISQYELERKPGRVSGPRGIQRSTYFLLLPYEFGVPCTIYYGPSPLAHNTEYISGTHNQVKQRWESQLSRAQFTGGLFAYGNHNGSFFRCDRGYGSRRARPCENIFRREKSMAMMSMRSGTSVVASHRLPGNTKTQLLPMEWEAVISKDGFVRCSFTIARDVEPLMVD